MNKDEIKMLFDIMPFSKWKMANSIGISHKTIERIESCVRYQPSERTKQKIRRYFKNIVKNIDRILEKH